MVQNTVQSMMKENVISKRNERLSATVCRKICYWHLWFAIHRITLKRDALFFFTYVVYYTESTLLKDEWARKTEGVTERRRRVFQFRDINSNANGGERVKLVRRHFLAFTLSANGCRKRKMSMKKKIISEENFIGKLSPSDALAIG